MATNKICGVSILRAGETMEQAVCDVCKDIRIGKILIQTNLYTGEPEVSNFLQGLVICFLDSNNVKNHKLKSLNPYKVIFSIHLHECTYCNNTTVF